MSSPEVVNSPADESSPSGSNNDLQIGDKIGRYRIISLLGQGGMGVVYKAQDTQLNRRVAIKVLPESVASDALALRQFIQEAQAAARLSHRNVTHVYEILRHGFGVCIVMEFIRGASVESVLHKKGSFAWREATQIVIEACRGLVAAHAAGLIHRDIKPGNIMLSESGQVKLADFGLVKVSGPLAVSLSSEYSTVGTPHYMSPEQCRSDPLDELTDIYSLGATYYALLVGKPPFPGKVPASIMFAHCSHAVPNPCDSVSELPAACAEIIRCAMAKQPAERFASATEMLGALKAVLGSRQSEPLITLSEAQPVESLSVRLAGLFEGTGRQLVAAGLLLVVVIAVSMFFRREPAIPVSPAIAAESQQSTTFQTETSQPPVNRDVRSESTDQHLIAQAGSALQQRDWPRLRMIVDDLNQVEHLDPNAAAFRERFTNVLKLRERIAHEGLPISCDGPVVGLAFSPDGRWLALSTAGEKGGLRLWDLTSGKPPFEQTPRFTNDLNGQLDVDFTSEYHGLTFSFDNENLAVAAGGTHPGKIAVWDMKTLHPEWLPELNTGISGIRALLYSADDRYLAALIDPQPANRVGIKIWNAETGQLVQECRVESKRLSAIAFHPLDSTKLITVGLEGKVRFWNTRTGQVDRTIETDITPASADSHFSLAFSPDGQGLALAGGGELQLWNVASGSCLHKVDLPGGSGGQVRFLPGGEVLVSGSGNERRGFTTLWDRQTFAKLHSIPSHNRAVHALAASTGDALVATGGEDNTLLLWDAGRWIQDNAMKSRERNGPSK